MIDSVKRYPVYKDSGVPSLGDVPEHWEVIPTGRIGRLFKGTGGTKADDVADGVPCVRYGDLYTQHNSFIRSSRSFVTQERSADYTPLFFGDVLFAGSGETIEEIGKSAVSLLVSPACCGGDVLLLRPTRPAVPEFLGYASDCPPAVHQKAVMGRGVTVVHIYADRLKYLWLPFPPLSEQAAIVRFLDHADWRIRRYIAAKKKLVALLNEQKQAIIHSAVTRGLDPNVRLKPSGTEWLGDVPEHWEVRKIGAISARVTKGTTPTTLGRSFTDAGIRFVKVESISKDRRLLSPLCAYIDSETDSLLARSRLRAGDVLVAIAGAIGRVAVAAEEDLPANCNQAVAIVSPVRSSVLPDWLAFALASPACQRVLADSSVQSAQANLSLADLRGTMIPVPPVPEQRRIVESLVDSTAVIAGAAAFAEREISLLGEYRNRLIADVVTGKLDVREAAARLPDEVEEPEPLDDADDMAEGDGSEVDEDLDAASVEGEA